MGCSLKQIHAAVTLLPSPKLRNSFLFSDAKEDEYRVITRTGSEKGAGTKSKVYIVLYGDDGKTKEKELTIDRADKEAFAAGKYVGHIPLVFLLQEGILSSKSLQGPARVNLIKKEFLLQKQSLLLRIIAAKKALKLDFTPLSALSQTKINRGS